MPLRTVRNQSLGDQVFEQLGREIVLGHFTPGEHLPPERTLVETFGVNRHVVREALKRLEQMGLIRGAQGDGTVVLDFKKTAGLDLLALMAEQAQADQEDMNYWLAVHEMRAAIAADAARLCAIRATSAQKAALLAIADRMKIVRDGPPLFDLEIEFWDLVIDGSSNIAYRLSYNTLVKAVLSPATVELARTWSIHEVKEAGYRVSLAKAIADGDAKLAEAKARDSMNLVVTFMRKQFGVAPGNGAKSRPKGKTAARPAKRRKRTARA